MCIDTLQYSNVYMYIYIASNVYMYIYIAILFSYCIACIYILIFIERSHPDREFFFCTILLNL